MDPETFTLISYCFISCLLIWGRCRWSIPSCHGGRGGITPRKVLIFCSKILHSSACLDAVFLYGSICKHALFQARHASFLQPCNVWTIKYLYSLGLSVISCLTILEDHYFCIIVIKLIMTIVQPSLALQAIQITPYYRILHIKFENFVVVQVIAYPRTPMAWMGTHPAPHGACSAILGRRVQLLKFL